MNAYTGHYYMMGLLFEVFEQNSGLFAGMRGVPTGYEVRLAGLGDDRFRMHGGPGDGSTAVFIRDDAGVVRALSVGPFELAKISAEKADSLPVVERLLAPEFNLTPEKQAAFQGLIDVLSTPGFAGRIEFNLPYPKHEFVQFLMSLDRFIFHGSGAADIEEFLPVRKSVEMYDRAGSGNLQAVYGTHDGLWAMFFAVVDRGRLEGSIRNGVMYMHNAGGERLAVYNFSVNQEQLAERPWRTGALYILPRDSFERQWLTPESPANEWASYVPVRPLAVLPVEPEDFPFLDRIGGHDDGILLRAGQLGAAIRESAQSAVLEGDLFEIVLPSSEKMGETVKDFVEIQEQLIPAARFAISEANGSLTLSVRSLPPAYRDVYRQTYGSLFRET